MTQFLVNKRNTLLDLSSLLHQATVLHIAQNDSASYSQDKYIPGPLPLYATTALE
jgi:hypothetical protein